MRFASLGSGSRGNATLVAAGGTALLVDCGFSVKETERRLASLEVAPGDLAGVLVTHEHADHASGVAALARRHDLRVWMTHGTFSMLRDRNIADLELFHAHASFVVDAVRVHPFPVPHDAAEPCQFVFEHAGERLGLLTDTGSITPHIVAQLQGCQRLILECNHDAELLRTGPYPAALRARVGGAYGHLENRQAARLLARLDTTPLATLAIAHVSQNNNTVESALRAVCEVLACDPAWPRVLQQEQVSGWL